MLRAERGAPESVFQDRLDHSKGSMMMRVYYQTADEERRAAVIALPVGVARPLPPESRL